MSRGSNVIDASHRDSVVVEVGAHGHFKDLGECNGAYEKLWAKCMPPDVRKPPPKITASPKYDHDRPAEAVAPRRRIGDRVIGEADTVEAKPIYHPPEARTGSPARRQAGITESTARIGASWAIVVIARTSRQLMLRSMSISRARRSTCCGSTTTEILT